MIRTCFILLLIFSGLSIHEAFAEFSCRAGLHYSWKKQGEEDALKVEWPALEIVSESEVEAKAKLEERLIKEKAKALEACRAEHENLSGCVAAKFSVMASVMQRLAFSARKSLEKAINADCSSRQGSCIKVESEEIKCTDLTPADGEEEDKKKK